MEKMLRSLVLTLVLLLPGLQSTCADQDSETMIPYIFLMRETGEYRDNLPVMEEVPATDQLFKLLHQNISNSFLLPSLEIYRLCQYYLVSEGQQQEIEPAYLALTENQGGYAKQGFLLQTQDGLCPKPGTPYVDITVKAATRDINGLMSVTQLYPHEMAHVLYRLLSPEDSLDYNSRSVDMHYFSIVTDYPTAFNEGFAEHMENVARHFEKNDSIRAGIEEDMLRIEKNSRHPIRGFTRDFLFPIRMGFYKASMVNWYQKFEDYKRAEYAINGKIRYKNKSLDLRRPEDRLSYRNAGLAQEESLRNIVQFHSTEGAISAFFTALSLRNQKSNHLPDSLFAGLLEAGLASPDPLEIQFLKYFYTLDHYLVRNNSSSSQFSDFVGAYIKSFPKEKEEVLALYKELTGMDFSPELPSSLWLLIRDFPHRMLIIDPFGAIKVPIYTFNLNAAEPDDLLSIRDLTKEEAEAIIEHRNKSGFFESLEDLKQVEGLSPGMAENISNLAFDKEIFEDTLEGFQPELSFSSLLFVPLLHVLLKALLHFILIFLFILYLLRKRETIKAGSLTKLSLRYLFLWLGLVILELVLLFLFPHSRALAFLPLLLFTILTLLVYRRKREKRNFTLQVLLVFLLLSLVSVI